VPRLCEARALAATARGLEDPLALHAEVGLASSAFGDTDSRAGLQEQLKNSCTDGVRVAQHFFKVCRGLGQRGRPWAVPKCS